MKESRTKKKSDITPWVNTIPDCINCTKPQVKIEVPRIQLDVEHAWDAGYKAGAPGFWLQLSSSVFGSGIISFSMLVALYFIKKNTDIYQLIVAGGCCIIGGLACLVFGTHRKKNSAKDNDITAIMKEYLGGRDNE